MKLASLLLLTLTTTLAAQTPLTGFDAYAEKAMRDWRVPGMAIAIVKDGKTVLAKGYGTRTVGRNDPVNEHTLFAVGSTTKAFTAALVGMLVDDGKVLWDDPVTKYLPEFQAYDPYVTREIAIRDILTHRSGLSRGDMSWWGQDDHGRDDLVRRIRYLKPSWSVRARFGYQNLMYLTAGQVVARVAGKTWDDVLRERILAPLGMNETNTSTKALAGNVNVATPHDWNDTTVVAIPYRNIDNIGPAGSINSTVSDYAKWIRFQLDSGRLNGKSLLATNTYVETHTAQMAIPLSAEARKNNPFTHYMNYGLGWFLQDYRGREVVQHGGNIDGMSALVAMMPEENLGFVIFTNMDGSGLPTILMRDLFDRFLRAPSRDWEGEAIKRRDDAEKSAKETERKKVEARAMGTSPSLPLEKYAGRYLDSLYGDASVRMERDHLVLQYGNAVTADLAHWHYNTFRGTQRGPVQGKFDVTFNVAADGTPAEMTIEIGETLKMRRMPKPADTTATVALSESEAQRLLGLFSSASPSVEMKVEWVSGVMKLNVPGQTPYTLVALSPTRFRLTGGGIPEGFYLTYTMDAGKVKQVVLEQPSPRPTLTLVPKQ